MAERKRVGSESETELLNAIASELYDPEQIHAQFARNPSAAGVPGDIADAIGAIDEAALAALDCGAGAARVEPRTEAERRIFEIWAEFLGFREFGVTDDFFALGGHSLLATQIISRVNDAFDIELPLALVFDESLTVGRLASAIEETAGASAPAPAGAPRLL